MMIDSYGFPISESALGQTATTTKQEEKPEPVSTKDKILYAGGQLLTSIFGPQTAAAPTQQAIPAPPPRPALPIGLILGGLAAVGAVVYFATRK